MLGRRGGWPATAQPAFTPCLWPSRANPRERRGRRGSCSCGRCAARSRRRRALRASAGAAAPTRGDPTSLRRAVIGSPLRGSRPWQAVTSLSPLTAPYRVVRLRACPRWWRMPDTFADRFLHLTGHTPLAWQRRLHDLVQLRASAGLRAPGLPGGGHPLRSVRRDTGDGVSGVF